MKIGEIWNKGYASLPQGDGRHCERESYPRPFSWKSSTQPKRHYVPQCYWSASLGFNCVKCSYPVQRTLVHEHVLSDLWYIWIISSCFHSLFLFYLSFCRCRWNAKFQLRKKLCTISVYWDKRTTMRISSSNEYMYLADIANLGQFSCRIRCLW